MVRGSDEVLVTATVKVNGPPGACRLLGSGVFTTVMVGGSGVRETVAWAWAVTWLPRWSTAITVTVSVWLSPPLPVNAPTNEQLYCPPLAASTAPTAQVPRPLRSP
jgi:hypothetical protein